MTDLWNPRNPRIIGLEWPVRKSVTYTLDSIGKSYGWVCRSTVTEQISQATFHVESVAGGNAKYAVEVYNLDDGTLAPEGIAVGSSILHATPVAGTDQDGQGYFDAGNGAGTNTPTSAHNCANTPETAGYGDVNADDAGTAGAHWLETTLSPGVGATYNRIMASIQSFDLTGQRIVAVTVRARAVGVNANVQPVFAERLQNGAGNPLSSGPDPAFVGASRAMGGYLNLAGPCNAASSPDAVAPMYEWRYERNPLTNFPWTAVEIMAYMVSAPRTNVAPGMAMVGIEFYALQPTTCALMYLEVEIEYCAEDRQSFGYQDIDAPGFRSIALTPFTKNVDETLLIVARKLSDGPGSITIRGLESDGFCPVGYTTMRPQVLNRAGQLALPLGQEREDVAGMLLRTPGAVYSVDSQVYMGLDVLPIDQNSSAVQTFVCDVGGVFGYVSLVASTEQLAGASGPLVVEIRDYLTANLIGSVSIATTDLNAAPQLLQYIGAVLDTPVTLVASTVYYMEVSTPSEPGNAWQVAVLDSMNSAGAQNTVGFGGPAGPPGGLFAWPDTSVGSFNGGQDMPFSVVQSPAAPRGFTVAKGVQ